VAHAGKQPPDLAVLAVIQTNLEKRAVPFRSDAANPLQVKPPFVKEHAFLEGDDGLRRRPTGNLDRIGPPDLESRMGQAVGQFAVVRDEDQSFAALVESADRKQPQLFARNEIDGARPARGIRVRAQNAAGLIEQEVARRLSSNGFAVDGDMLAIRFDARSEIANDFAVDADSPRDNILFATSARAKARGGEKPLQPNAARLAVGFER
jgi:hypothetical protein